MTVFCFYSKKKKRKVQEFLAKHYGLLVVSARALIVFNHISQWNIFHSACVGDIHKACPHIFNDF